MSSRNIGGSILASSEPRILLPMVTSFGMLQVVEHFDEDTHVLQLDPGSGTTERLASHPNGFCCHELAVRMLAGDPERVRKQVEWITDCGGKCAPVDRILELLK